MDRTISNTESALHISALSCSCFLRWPSSCNRMILFLHCLLPSIYFKKLLLLSSGQLELQLSFGQINFLPQVESCISLFHVIWPCFHCTCTFLFCPVSERRSLFSQAGLFLTCFCHLGIACSSDLRRWCLKCGQHRWTPAASKNKDQSLISAGVLSAQVSPANHDPWWQLHSTEKYGIKLEILEAL